MDVGLELRQARERRGIPLQQISDTTKISLRVLQAIELSNESRLPAMVFTRSFVKTYATLVGLDPADTTRRYLEQFAPPAAPEPPESVRESIPDTPLHPEPTIRRIARVLKGRFGTATVLLLTAVTTLMLLVKNYKPATQDTTRKAAPPPVSAAGTVPAVAHQTEPVGTAGTTHDPDVLRLAIAPTGPCWVQATVDGHAVLAKLLAAGERREVEARGNLTLRVGDPSAFAFTINGAPARISSPHGEAVTVHITKENYSRFLTR
jgi:cytoskeleton protein RodZ